MQATKLYLVLFFSTYLLACSFPGKVIIQEIEESNQGELELILEMNPEGSYLTSFNPGNSLEVINFTLAYKKDNAVVSCQEINLAEKFSSCTNTCDVVPGSDDRASVTVRLECPASQVYLSGEERVTLGRIKTEIQNGPPVEKIKEYYIDASELTFEEARTETIEAITNLNTLNPHEIRVLTSQLKEHESIYSKYANYSTWAYTAHYYPEPGVEQGDTLYTEPYSGFSYTMKYESPRDLVIVTNSPPDYLEVEHQLIHSIEFELDASIAEIPGQWEYLGDTQIGAFNSSGADNVLYWEPEEPGKYTLKFKYVYGEEEYYYEFTVPVIQPQRIAQINATPENGGRVEISGTGTVLDGSIVYIPPGSVNEPQSVDVEMAEFDFSGKLPNQLSVAPSVRFTNAPSSLEVISPKLSLEPDHYAFLTFRPLWEDHAETIGDKNVQLVNMYGKPIDELRREELGLTEVADRFSVILNDKLKKYIPKTWVKWTKMEAVYERGEGYNLFWLKSNVEPTPIKMILVREKLNLLLSQLKGSSCNSIIPEDFDVNIFEFRDKNNNIMKNVSGVVAGGTYTVNLNEYLVVKDISYILNHTIAHEFAHVLQNRTVHYDFKAINDYELGASFLNDHWWHEATAVNAGVRWMDYDILYQNNYINKIAENGSVVNLLDGSITKDGLSSYRNDPGKQSMPHYRNGYFFNYLEAKHNYNFCDFLVNASYIKSIEDLSFLEALEKLTGGLGESYLGFVEAHAYNRIESEIKGVSKIDNPWDPTSEELILPYNQDDYYQVDGINGGHALVIELPENIGKLEVEVSTYFVQTFANNRHRGVASVTSIKDQNYEVLGEIQGEMKDPDDKGIHIEYIGSNTFSIPKEATQLRIANARSNFSNVPQPYVLRVKLKQVNELIVNPVALSFTDFHQRAVTFRLANKPVRKLTVEISNPTASVIGPRVFAMQSSAFTGTRQDKQWVDFDEINWNQERVINLYVNSEIDVDATEGYLYFSGLNLETVAVPMNRPSETGLCTYYNADSGLWGGVCNQWCYTEDNSNSETEDVCIARARASFEFDVNGKYAVAQGWEVVSEPVKGDLTVLHSGEKLEGSGSRRKPNGSLFQYKLFRTYDSTDQLYEWQFRKISNPAIIEKRTINCHRISCSRQQHYVEHL